MGKDESKLTDPHHAVVRQPSTPIVVVKTVQRESLSTVLRSSPGEAGGG